MFTIGAKEELRLYRQGPIDSSRPIAAQTPPPSSLPCWSRPPSGFYKHNWDAACDKNQGTIGFGAIIKDNDGRFCGSVQASRPYNSHSFIAEAYALWLVANFCKDVGF